MRNVIFGLILIFSLPTLAADFTIELVPAAGSIRYEDVANKPSEFNPAPHNHSISEITNLQSSLKAPTVQKFTNTGSATYTTPTNPSPLYIKIKMVGGGGGGGAGPQGFISAGTDGGQTSFGGTILVANGGGAGTIGGGTGGSFLIGSGVTWHQSWPGQAGGGSISERSNGDTSGGSGAGSVLFGGGGLRGPSGAPGYHGIPNTGAGGAGGNTVTFTGGSAGGGGSGASIMAQINNPASQYAISVGTGGVGGSGNYPGGNGGSGFIIVEEYYQ